MLPAQTERVSNRLPERLDINYFADRQSPWLLAHTMPARARIADLRRGRMAKLLGRPMLRPLLARSGGVLSQPDVVAVAHADDLTRLDRVSPAGEAGLDVAWQSPWLDFHVTFTTWGSRGDDWRQLQISRPGHNLVIQLSFPSDHAKLMRDCQLSDARCVFEEARHPIRTEGRPTLAWARVDLDVESGEALIEEVQCDWLRFAKEEAQERGALEPKHRLTKALAMYERLLSARYGKIWPQAMMFVTLLVLRDLLGFRVIWMHQPDAGALLKGITEQRPPRSIYRHLPKAFCFRETSDAPHFLAAKVGCRRTKWQNQRMRQVRHMQRLGRSIFWRLDL